jgi:beta-lactamase regulating signal transducer with metallopeptidase domain
MLEALFEAALRSLALTTIVWSFLKLSRLRSPEIQLTAWTIVVLASLATPLVTRLAAELAPAAGTSPVSIDAMLANPLDLTANPPRLPSDGAPIIHGAEGATLVAGFHSFAAWFSAGRGASIALLVYGGVAAALLIRLVAGVWLTFRILRKSKPLREAWADGADIRISDDIAAPATFGSSILLPNDSLEWSERKRSAVLAHEAAHVRRADFYLLIAANLNRVVFWFNPVSWWLQAKLSALAEAASDDAAIARVRDRLGYAEILLDLSRRPAVLRSGVAMARPATIRSRIDRILTASMTPEPASRRARFALVLGIAPLAAVTAVAWAHSTVPTQETMVSFDEQIAPHRRISIGPALLDADVGYYEDQKTGVVLTVVREDEHLLVGRTGKTPQPEYPYADHDFFLTTAAEQDAFVTDDDAKVLRVVHKKYGLATSFERISSERAAQLEADHNRRVEEELAPRTPIKIETGALDRYVGFYQLNPSFIFAITRQGDQLYAQASEQQKLAVFPYTQSDFFYTAVAAQLSFQGPLDAPATGLILHQDGRDRMASRVSADVAQALHERLNEELKPHSAVPVDHALLDRYVGRYANPNIAMAITREGDHLLAQVLGYNKYRVYSYSDHDFFATTFAVQLSFTTDPRGRSIQLVRHEHGQDIAMARAD